MEPGEQVRSVACRRAGHPKAAAARGFTYVLMLVAIVIAGLAVARVGPMWAESAQRQQEEDLLRVGELYARAIASYHDASPGTVRHFPARLEDLVEDNRFVGTRRHIRRLYADPLRPDRPWGLLRTADGGIVAVYSQDARRPWRRHGLSGAVMDLPAAQRYEQWKFGPR